MGKKVKSLPTFRKRLRPKQKKRVLAHSLAPVLGKTLAFVWTLSLATADHFVATLLWYPGWWVVLARAQVRDHALAFLALLAALRALSASRCAAFSAFTRALSSCSHLKSA